MHGWIDPFYEKAQPAIEPGQIWCAQPISLPPRHALKLGKIDPKDDSKLEFKIGGRTADSFGHPPVHSLGLRSDEAIVVTKARRDRHVVVLGGTTATELRTAGTPDAGSVMVVPVHGADGLDEDTRRRVRHYGFTNAFYLPTCERPRYGESLARLDHTQPVAREHLVEPLGLKLSADALDALVEWFVAFATDRLPDESMILEYRREMLGKDA